MFVVSYSQRWRYLAIQTEYGRNESYAGFCIAITMFLEECLFVRLSRTYQAIEVTDKVEHWYVRHN